MQLWSIKAGCYEAEVSVRDDGSVSMGTFCKASNPLGHYVAVTQEQAAQLARFLCNHVPGAAEAVMGKLTEI